MNYYQSEEKKGIGEGNVYTEQDLAIKADNPLVDSGTGKKVIIRMFDFEWKKGMKKEEIEQVVNNKQTLFNSYAKYIKDFLWKDGLSVLEHEDPKLEFTKKGYRIAVACEARFGLNIFEKGMTLQDLMKSHNRKMDKKK